MAHLSKLIRLGLILALCATAAVAQEEPAAEEEAAPEAPRIEEVIVVTASRTEQRLQEVPAAMTVISAEQLETAPADDYGDILRNVPGLNVSQMSARDIQITGRAATSSLATSELVLLDGRTLYLDFFGFVMWDYLPVNPREIKQVEVVRGPGSAVWGANAMSGVINLITKTPAEMAGTSVLVGGGELGTAYGSISHAGVRGNVGYKLSGGYYEQDAYDRPTGVIEETGQPYPTFANQGTEQPKADLRIDYAASPETLWIFGAGYAGTDGIMHSGIGPFDIDKGSSLSFAKVGWSRRAMKANFFANVLDGEAANLLTFDTLGRPLALGFNSETYNLDFSNTSVVGTSHIFTYGANARANRFDLTIAPAGDNRDEYGVFIQDEILLGNKVRWLVGGRWDNIDPIRDVFSPRTSLLIAPTPNHTFRVSYNRAFRAPSLIQNFLDITIFNQALIDPRLIAAAIAPPGVPCEFVLTVCTPFLYSFPSDAVGNSRLQEEKLDAYEVGWVGTFGTTTVGLAAYRNETTDSTDFFARDFYSPFAPPPAWPVFLRGPVPIPVVPPETFPSAFSYQNIGEIVDQGVEFTLDGRAGAAWTWFFNYSWQDAPEVTGFDPALVNTPPENRANFGLGYNGPRFFVNSNVNYVDEARWTDVLDARFHGTTDSYTQVNLGAGVRLAGEKVTVSVIGSNIFDEEVQQHIFGDLIGRKVVGQVLFNF